MQPNAHPENHHQTLIIEEFEPDVFRQLIEYIHTGCVTLQPRTLLGDILFYRNMQEKEHKDNFGLFRCNERSRLLRAGRVEEGLLGIHPMLRERGYCVCPPSHRREIYPIQVYQEPRPKSKPRPLYLFVRTQRKKMDSKTLRSRFWNS